MEGDILFVYFISFYGYTINLEITIALYNFLAEY